PARDEEFIRQRKIHALALTAVAQGRIINLDPRHMAPAIKKALKRKAPGPGNDFVGIHRFRPRSPLRTSADWQTAHSLRRGNGDRQVEAGDKHYTYPLCKQSIFSNRRGRWGGCQPFHEEEIGGFCRLAGGPARRAGPPTRGGIRSSGSSPFLFHPALDEGNRE